MADNPGVAESCKRFSDSREVIPSTDGCEGVRRLLEVVHYGRGRGIVR